MPRRNKLWPATGDCTLDEERGATRKPGRVGLLKPFLGGSTSGSFFRRVRVARTARPARTASSSGPSVFFRPAAASVFCHPAAAASVFCRKQRCPGWGCGPAGCAQQLRQAHAWLHGRMAMSRARDGAAVSLAARERIAAIRSAHTHACTRVWTAANATKTPAPARPPATTPPPTRELPPASWAGTAAGCCGAGGADAPSCRWTFEGRLVRGHVKQSGHGPGAREAWGSPGRGKSNKARLSSMPRSPPITQTPSRLRLSLIPRSRSLIPRLSSG